MSDENITDRVLEGGEYECAKATVRQMFSIPLRTKIRVSILSLLVTVLLAPAVVLRQDLVAVYEGTRTFDLVLGRLAILGMTTVFLAGVLLVRQQRLILVDSMSAERARKLVRVQDLLMWFVLLGSVFVLIATLLAWFPVVFGGAVDRLYGAGIRIYRPTTVLGLDVRLVSALGGLLSLVLFALRTAVYSDR